MKRVCHLLPDELVKRLDRDAKRAGINRSELIRRLLAMTFPLNLRHEGKR